MCVCVRGLESRMNKLRLQQQQLSGSHSLKRGPQEGTGNKGRDEETKRTEIELPGSAKQ